MCLSRQRKQCDNYHNNIFTIFTYIITKSQGLPEALLIKRQLRSVTAAAVLRVFFPAYPGMMDGR